MQNQQPGHHGNQSVHYQGMQWANRGNQRVPGPPNQPQPPPQQQSSAPMQSQQQRPQHQYAQTFTQGTNPLMANTNNNASFRNLNQNNMQNAPNQFHRNTMNNMNGPTQRTQYRPRTMTGQSTASQFGIAPSFSII